MVLTNCALGSLQMNKLKSSQNPKMKNGEIQTMQIHHELERKVSQPLKMAHPIIQAPPVTNATTGFGPSNFFGKKRSNL